MADVNTGTSGTLRVTASVTASSTSELWWDVTWAVYLIERKASNSTFNNIGTPYSVSVQGVGTVATGSFTFDWRPAGLQTTLIASGTTRIYAPPSGSGAGLGNVTGSIGSTNTSGAGGPTSVTQSVSLPTLTTAPDAPTNVVATRVSDTAITLAWQANPAAGKPYDGQSVWVSIDGAAYTFVANVTAATETYTYASLANHKYAFKITASNGAGSTTSAASNTIITTPAALPTLVATSISSGTIRLTLPARPTPHTDAEVVITETHDGGDTWNSKTTIAMSSLSASGTTTWDDTSAQTGGTVQYKAVVRTTSGTQGTLSSSEKLSNILTLNTPPNAPTNLTPSGAVDASRAIRLAWTHNPSSDGAAQSSRKIEYSTDGGSSQTAIVTGNSTVSYYDWTPTLGSFTPGQAILYRVATAGSQPGTYGAWSEWQTLILYGGLAVTLVDDEPPTTHGGGPIPVGWESSATWGTATQTQYQVTMTDNSTGQVVYDSGAVTSTEEYTEIPSSVQVNEREYTVTLVLTDNHQIHSVPVTRVVTTDYLAPGPVDVDWTYDDESGQLMFTPTFSPESSSAFDDTVAWSLERSIDDGATWVLVATAGGEYAINDPIPRLGVDALYRTQSFSALGVAGEPTEHVVPAADLVSRWSWLNYGENFQAKVRFGWDQGVDIAPGRPSESNEIEGVDYPVPVFGAGATEEFSIRGLLLYGDIPATLATSTVEDIRALAKDATVCVFRDAGGNWFTARLLNVRVSPERQRASGPQRASVAFTVERVAS